MAKQMFYEFTKKGIRKLKPNELKKFGSLAEIDISNNHNQFINSKNSYFSISFDKSINDFIVYIWADTYSLAVTGKELKAIHNMMQDKDKIMQELVANEV